MHVHDSCNQYVHTRDIDMNTLHLIQAPLLIKSLDLNIHKALRDVVSTVPL
jgi:hypothetical protein